MQFRYHITNVKGAILRFARRMLITKRLTVLMLMGTCALVGIVLLYYADSRLMVGPWHTYASGLFSVNEPRDEHFEEFALSGNFQRELERRGGGPLLAAFQKSVVSEQGEVVDILHINVYDLSHHFKSFFRSNSREAQAYLSSENPYFKDYDVRVMPKIDGHLAMLYKSRVRDEGGYYVRGLVICAHRRAYFYESYSNHSPFLDAQNDSRTYFFDISDADHLNFTVDDMDAIENRFFCLSLLLFAAYVLAGMLAFRMITRGIIHQGPDYPVVDVEAHKRCQWVCAFTVVVALVMMVMMVAFWQYKGTKPIQTTAFLLLGIALYALNLPVTIHLYKKARDRLPHKEPHAPQS